jgi:hypothetical protein
MTTFSSPGTCRSLRQGTKFLVRFLFGRRWKRCGRAYLLRPRNGARMSRDKETPMAHEIVYTGPGTFTITKSQPLGFCRDPHQLRHQRH